jgi:hypothetical protein
MTSHPIEDTKIGDAIEAEAKRLEALDIAFEVIGQERLSQWLKDQPRIVDDFFSRAWVEEFCGQCSPGVPGQYQPEWMEQPGEGVAGDRGCTAGSSSPGAGCRRGDGLTPWRNSAIWYAMK